MSYLSLITTLRREQAQASVELVAVLPAIALVALLVWQLALAGHTAWQAGSAAQVAARAQAVGGDPAKAARSALPGYLEDDLYVKAIEDGDDEPKVRVRLSVPLLLPQWKTSVHVAASANLPDQTT